MSPSTNLTTLQAAQVLKELELSHKGKLKTGGDWRNGDPGATEIYEDKGADLVITMVNRVGRGVNPSETVMTYTKGTNDLVGHVIKVVLEEHRPKKTKES